MSNYYFNGCYSAIFLGPRPKFIAENLYRDSPMVYLQDQKLVLKTNLDLSIIITY